MNPALDIVVLILKAAQHSSDTSFSLPWCHTDQCVGWRCRDLTHLGMEDED